MLNRKLILFDEKDKSEQTAILSTHPNSDKVESRTPSPNSLEVSNDIKCIGFTRGYWALWWTSWPFTEDEQINVVWQSKIHQSVLEGITFSEESIEPTSIR